MSSKLSLTYRDKVLLFLRDYIYLDEEKELPEEITQKGISEKVGMSRTHVSRVLKDLRDDGLLKEKLYNVIRHERKLKTYRLTSKGFEKAEKMYEDILAREIPVISNGEKKDMDISEVLEKYSKNFTLLDLICTIESEKLPIKIIDKEKTFWRLKDTPEIEKFIDRERELDELNRWFESDIPFAVVLGRRGYGSSTLARYFVERVDKHVLWIKTNNRSLKHLKNQISSFLSNFYENDKKDLSILKKLSQTDVLLVFDDYYEVDDDLVDFLDECIEMSKNDIETKFLITSRKGIPVYERFYKIDDVKNDKVREVDISPFDKDDAQKLLGTRLKENALDRLMLMTKGSPLLLKLLKEGNREKLHKVSPLSREQISLLMFLKSESKE